MVAAAIGFLKFPNNVKVPWPAEVTGLPISPHNGFQSPQHSHILYPCFQQITHSVRQL